MPSVKTLPSHLVPCSLASPKVALQVMPAVTLRQMVRGHGDHSMRLRSQLGPWNTRGQVLGSVGEGWGDCWGGGCLPRVTRGTTVCDHRVNLGPVNATALISHLCKGGCWASKPVLLLREAAGQAQGQTPGLAPLNCSVSLNLSFPIHKIGTLTSPVRWL